MITVTDLTFDYPGTRALERVSFTVAAGSITALVGPNGAGKTTLLRCLAALDEPLAGGITINGIDVVASPRKAHRSIGFLADFFGIYEELTVRQCLTYRARVNGVSAKDEATAVNRAAERLGIADRLAQRAGNLSRGLRQRLAIAQAIIHEPKILILDEPAAGLDPEARHSLSQLFRSLRDSGMTLIVSSHILTELAEYSTDMIVIRNGRIVAQQRVSGTDTVTSTIRFSLAAPHEGIAPLLASLNGVSNVRLEGLSGTFSCPADPVAQQQLLRQMVERGLPLRAFVEEEPDLQGAYLATITAEPHTSGR
ncbi:MAG TPA: ABC transporter ATP-binding protein [Geobacterales bacterium]|nr:ABC transporter ATP-binding protein [Geobacterales bacterium]